MKWATSTETLICQVFEELMRRAGVADLDWNYVSNADQRWRGSRPEIDVDDEGWSYATIDYRAPLTTYLRVHAKGTADGFAVRIGTGGMGTIDVAGNGDDGFLSDAAAAVRAQAEPPN